MTELFVPKTRLLNEIVRANVGPRAALSIASQCVFYMHHRLIIARLYPDLKIGYDSLDDIVKHISEFSLAALRSIKRGPPPLNQPRRSIGASGAFIFPAG